MLRLEVDRTMSSRVSSWQKPSNISTCSSGTDKPSMFCKHYLRLRITDALDCLTVTEWAVVDRFFLYKLNYEPVFVGFYFLGYPAILHY
jgi:hypothetical protein